MSLYTLKDFAKLFTHPEFQGVDEWFKDEENGNLTAYCLFLRKDKKTSVKSYSFKEAVIAGFFEDSYLYHMSWKKQLPIMLMKEARSLAFESNFPDVLHECE